MAFPSLLPKLAFFVVLLWGTPALSAPGISTIGPKQVPNPSVPPTFEDFDGNAEHSPEPQHECSEQVPHLSPEYSQHETPEETLDASPYETYEDSLDISPYETPCETTEGSPEETVEENANPFELPLRTPSPETSFGNGPTPDSDFQHLTSLSGSSADSKVVSDASSASYRFTYDVTFLSSGVVSLDSLASVVTGIACDANNVRIQISPDYALSDLSSMYPVGGVLVVNADIYGSCPSRSGSEVGPTEDLYLRIDAVYGEPHDAVIEGEPTLYFAIFEKASLKVVNLDETAIALNSSRALVRQNAKSASLPLDLLLNEPPNLNDILEIQLATKGKATAGYEVISANYENGELDFVMDFVYELFFSTQFGVKLKAVAYEGKASPKSFVQLLLTIPGLQILGPAAAKLPALRLGIYVETKMLAEISLNLLEDIRFGAQNRFSSGRTRYRLSAQGKIISLPFLLPIPDLSFDLEELNSSAPDFSGDSNDTPTDADFKQESRPISASAFVGAEIGLFLSISAFEFRVSKQFGVGVELKAAIGGAAFPPLETALVDIGACDLCHKIQWGLSAICRNSQFRVGLQKDTKVHRFLDFLKELALEIPLQQQPLKKEVIAGCHLPEFGSDTERCGSSDVCCDKSQGGCSIPTGSAKEPTCVASPSPSPAPKREQDVVAGVFADPHLRTFDGSRFDCMATGEFVYVDSPLIGLLIQARFEGPTTSGSVTTGIVIRDGDSPTLQISNSTSEGNTSFEVDGCPVSVYLDSKLVGKSAIQKAFTIVENSALGGFVVATPKNITIALTMTNSNTFGCYMVGSSVSIPGSLANAEDFKGLLGNANGQISDDFMARDGSPLKGPEDLSEEYEYCVKNWCINSEDESIFTYGAGESFSSFNQCDKPYEPIDLSSASPALQALCGNDRSCLIDGIVTGNLEEANNSLQAEQNLNALVSSASSLSFSPTAIVVGDSEQVTVRVFGDASTSQVISYQIYRINPSTLEAIGKALTTATKSEDAFLGTFGLLSDSAGEAFDFVARPVTIDGETKDESQWIYSFVAIISYSKPSSGGESLPTTTPFPTPSIDPTGGFNITTAVGVFASNIPLNQLSLRFTIEWDTTTSATFKPYVSIEDFDESSEYYYNCSARTVPAFQEVTPVAIQDGKKRVTVTSPLSEIVARTEQNVAGADIGVARVDAEVKNFNSGEVSYTMTAAFTRTSSGEVILDESPGQGGSAQFSTSVLLVPDILHFLDEFNCLFLGSFIVSQVEGVSALSGGLTGWQRV